MDFHAPAKFSIYKLFFISSFIAQDPQYVCCGTEIGRMQYTKNITRFDFQRFKASFCIKIMFVLTPDRIEVKVLSSGVRFIMHITYSKASILSVGRSKKLLTLNHRHEPKLPLWLTLLPLQFPQYPYSYLYHCHCHC